MAAIHHLIHCDAEAIATWERAAPTLDDDPQARIVVLSPELPLDAALELIPCWRADTPEASWIEVQVRVRGANGWSRFYRIAAWDSASEQSRRSSFADQRDDDGRVATDTLIATRPASAAQLRVLLCAEPGADMPDLEDVTICVSGPEAAAPAFVAPPATPAIALPLLLSQYAYPEGAGWCSPTAVSMALAYWRAQRPDLPLDAFADAACVAQVAAPQIFDPAWEGTGNWAFNTAFAAAHGLHAYVTRLHSLEQVARWTAAGVPVIISISWQVGQIDGAPGSTAGHLTMVIGFGGGTALMAEPAGRGGSEAILRSYPADQLFARWQAASRGTVYLIYPPDWPTPTAGPDDAWIS
ncbi:MAG: peptidase C39 family protein [Oscillochloris sp.]|nr:peptidase C39 family protein [Oscillochloris sp.]